MISNHLVQTIMFNTKRLTFYIQGNFRIIDHSHIIDHKEEVVIQSRTAYFLVISVIPSIMDTTIIISSHIKKVYNR